MQSERILLFYSDCDDFFIIDFIFGMSKKKKLPPHLQKKRTLNKFLFLCGLIGLVMRTYPRCWVLKAQSNAQK